MSVDYPGTLLLNTYSSNNITLGCAPLVLLDGQCVTSIVVWVVLLYRSWFGCTSGESRLRLDITYKTGERLSYSSNGSILKIKLYDDARIWFCTSEAYFLPATSVISAVVDERLGHQTPTGLAEQWVQIDVMAVKYALHKTTEHSSGPITTPWYQLL